MTYVLNQSTLVLEGVTLAQVVELVVEVLVDLAGGTVADEETTENTHAAHPKNLAVERKTAYQHELFPHCIFHWNVRSREFRDPAERSDDRIPAYLGIRASLVPLRLPRPR
jgi:hypothetical protein